MGLGSRNSSNSINRIAAVAVAFSFAALAGCTSTRSYTLPNGRTAYEVKCSLWYQCTGEAKKMCPRGYRLVRGPLRPQLAPSNSQLPQGPSRIDFACK